MFRDAEEEWGDPDDKLLKHLKTYGHLSGMIDDGGLWELTLYQDGDEAKGRSLMEIKGVKMWHELRIMPPLPPFPLLPFPPDPDAESSMSPAEMAERQEFIDGLAEAMRSDGIDVTVTDEGISIVIKIDDEDKQSGAEQ
jgi:hypothetical protein